jgi:quercetin dioxygenase-like cupin family protein
VSVLRRRTAEGAWEGTDVLAYKEAGSAPFRTISRQILFDDPNLQCQLRYFEIAAAGYSTLERHEHTHAVMVVRGRGRCLVGAELYDVGLHDLISIPPLTWHQFRAAEDGALGFLCMVNNERDRPQLPTPAQLEELRRDPALAAFIAV